MGTIQDNSSIILYTTDDGNIQLDVKLDNETVWLTQEQMSVLFDRDQSVISRHIRNIYKEGELDKESTYAKFAYIPETRDRSYDVVYYNLDVVISVGYRVKSINGTRFRQWANSILKQYLIQGYVVNQKRLDHYNELKDVVRLMSRTAFQSDVAICRSQSAPS